MKIIISPCPGMDPYLESHCTPRLSTLADGYAGPGRDHWGAVQSIFFAGGGIRGGTVIGSSDRWKASVTPRGKPPKKSWPRTLVGRGDVHHSLIACIRRSWRGSHRELYSFPLRKRLPALPIPLRSHEP